MPPVDAVLWGEELSQWLECIQPDGGPVAMLKVTVDESGSHGGDPLLCVALCLSTPTQWRHFVDEWRPFLATLPDEVKHYHAKDPQCKALNEPLAALMARRMGTVHAITILDSEYKRATSDRYRSFVGGSYATAVQAGMITISHWCSENSPQFVAYVLESGHKGQPHVDRLLTSYAKDAQLRAMLRLASHTWSPKGEPMLDPADFVSHVVSGYKGNGVPPSLAPLGDKLHLHHLDEENTRQSANEVEKMYAAHKRNLKASKRSIVGAVSSPSTRRTSALE